MNQNPKQNIIIDSSYLCYRAAFTMGDLSHEDKGTGVIFGFLSQIHQLAKKFDYPNFIFAWDSRKSFRRDLYHDYKKKNKEMTPEMIELMEVAKPQFQEIRINVLPILGFKNTFIQVGIEADDIIAMILEGDVTKEFTTISSDNDLYQLLGHRFQMYDPKKKEFYSAKDFINEYGINPDEWAKVKSIAGCDTDNVKGILNVGVKTAIKYVKGELKGSKVKLIQESSDIIHMCSTLVSLPHPRTLPVHLTKDEFSFANFETMCLNYGFRSFLKKGVYEEWKEILNC